MLELAAARDHRQRSAFEILRRLDRRIVEHHDGGRVAAKNAADGLDLHALGDAVACRIAVGKADLRRLVGDQLGGVAGALAGGDRDIEAGVAIEALIVCDEEAEVRAFIDPIERHGHRLERHRGARAGRRERQRERHPLSALPF